MNHLIAHEKAQSYFWLVNSPIYNLIIFFKIINLVDGFILELTVHQLYCSSINIHKALRKIRNPEQRCSKKQLFVRMS